MGKPSSSQLSNSNHSLISSTSRSKMNVTLSSQKMTQKKKQRKSKTRKNIKKLFEMMRRDSRSSMNECSNNTVISLDNTAPEQSSVNNREINESNQRSMKRKNSFQSVDVNKRRKDDGNLIIINDDVSNDNDNDKNVIVTIDESCELNSPKRSKSHIDCSTPITQTDSKTLKEHIIDNFSNSENAFRDEVINLTKAINRDSYLTIDLTVDSENRPNKTVIDLEDSEVTHDDHDCTVISVSNMNSSMSGDSDVTVINAIPGRKKNKEMRKIANGIAKMNASQKGKLLELITQKIFNGCNVPTDVKNSLSNIQETISKATETVEDTYIKEVILGEVQSRNSIGSNIYHPDRKRGSRVATGLRMIVIDGSNVAMEHGKGKVFSVKGLKICIEYFLRRGHVVKAFVPRFRCKFGKSTDGKLLDTLERQGLVVYTPSREVQGKMITSYDDRYIVQCAAEFDGIIVSGDNYRDLLRENPRWRFVIENRTLPFTWVEDMIMFPRDPFGRYGPSLEELLKHPTKPNV